MRIFSGKARHLRFKAANAAHHHRDVHPGLRRFDELVDELFVGDGVHLQKNLRRIAGFRNRDFLVNQMDDRRFEAFRRHQKVGARFGEVAHKEAVEHRRRIRADFGIAVIIDRSV